MSKKPTNAELKARVSDLECINATINAEIVSRNHRCEFLEQENKSLKSNLSLSRKSNEQLRKDRDELDKRVAELESELEATTGKKSMWTDIKEIEIAGLECELTSVKQSHESALSRAESAERENARLKSSEASLAASVRALQERLNEAQQVSDGLYELANSRLVEVSELSFDLAAQTRKFANLESDFFRLDRDYRDLQERLIQA